jgi:ribose-phosphate pyrophosphokinase
MAGVGRFPAAPPIVSPSARASLLVSPPGSSALSTAVCNALGAAPTPLVVEHFPDDELHVSLPEPVRNRRVYLLQPLGAPIGESLLSMALAADAIRRGGAASLVGIVPYLAYARQDRRRTAGDALGAAVVAALLDACRFERLVLLDLHTPTIEGLFGCPVEHLSAEPLLARALAPLVDTDGVVVAPDLGAAKLARRYAQRLGLPVAIVHKTRLTAREVTTGEVAGEVRGRRPVIVDDMISTGTTVAAAAAALLHHGALPDVIVAATHAVFAPGWQATLAPTSIRHILVTDSLANPHHGGGDARVQRVSLAPMLADVIRRLDGGLDLGELLSSA